MIKRCDRCHKPINEEIVKIQLSRYGHKGPEMNLCTPCYRAFKFWFNPEQKNGPYPVSDYIQ